MTLFWQWRQHWAGQEMLHGTCVNAQGHFTPGAESWTQLATEYKEQGEWLLQNPPASADVAILLDEEASWAFSIDPTDTDMQYGDRWRDDYYMPLVRQQIWRDVIHQSADLDRYKVIIAPLLPVIEPENAERLKAWVEQGGILIIGPYTSIRTTEFTIDPTALFGPMESLVGSKKTIHHTLHWITDCVEMEFASGLSERSQSYACAFEPEEGAEVLATWRGGWMPDSAAVL